MGSSLSKAVAYSLFGFAISANTDFLAQNENSFTLSTPAYKVADSSQENNNIPTIDIGAFAPQQQNFNSYNPNDYTVSEPEYLKLANFDSQTKSHTCGCFDEINKLDDKLDNILSLINQRKHTKSANNGYAPPAAIMNYVGQYTPQAVNNHYGGGNIYDYGYGQQKRKSGIINKKENKEQSGGHNSIRTDEAVDKNTNQWFSAEKNNDGYSQQVAYGGASKWLDEQAAQEGYQKQENHSNGAHKVEDAARYEAGAKENQGLTAKVRKQSQNLVDYEQKLSDNFNNEQHSGMYKGNEFDVAYKAQDQQGGYKEYENEKMYDAQKSDGFSGKSELSQTGDYNGKDYLNGKDWSTDGDYETRTTDGRPDLAAKMGDIAGMERQSKDLYNAYKGAPREKSKSTKDDWFGPSTLNTNNNNKDGSNDEINEKKLFGGYETGEYYQDGDKREYGSAFDGKDTSNKSYDNKGFVKAQQSDKTKQAYDIGSYRDVTASGHNKAADYKGDYSTIKTNHDTQYELRDNREFKEDIDTDYQEDRYAEKYADAKANGAFANEKNGGKYYDTETYKQYDANAKKKAYEADSYSNGKNSEGHIDIALQKQHEQDKTVQISNGDYNNHHYNKYGKGYNNNGYY